MSYPGGKNGAGVFQRIINLIPPHRVYIEPFAGHAAVLRHKAPAASTIAIDADAEVCRWLRDPRSPFRSMRAFTVIHGDGIEFLAGYAWRGDEFVYCDPPYVLSTRATGKIYSHELSDDQHADLLSTLATIPAAVMVSGYRSALYDDALESWHRVDYMGRTRGGNRPECLWLNYQEPTLLHDTRYLGANFRERERIQRKRRRWVKNLMAMPAAERNAIFTSLVEAMRPAASPSAPRRTASANVMGIAP